MGLVETDAIVLKNYSLSESDKIVLFLTQKNGLIRGVAKGARKLNSRFGSGLEPLTVVSLAYFEKEQRELVSINSVELRTSYFSKISDYSTLKRFSYLIELLTEFLPPNDSDEILFRMTKACMQAAESTNLDFITIYFEVWLLKQSGYFPNLSKCFNCNKEFSASDNQFYTNTFEIICFNCQNKKVVKMISANERATVGKILKLSPMDFSVFAVGYIKEIQNLSLLTQSIISNTIGKK
jgi:DNA repair protein RecO (recombination protein O)